MKLFRRMLLLFAVMVLLPFSVRAAGKNTIIVRHSRDGVAAANVVFTLYKVDKSYTDPYEAYISVVKSGKKPVSTAVTDQRGRTEFTGLADGKYLVTGGAYIVEDKVCEPEMMLVQLPAKVETDAPLNKVVVIPKYSMRENSEETVYRVMIIWDDEESTRLRPNAVSVQLFRDGKKHSIVKPDKDGNWQYTWTESDPLVPWAVQEKVPEKYKASYSRDGNTFVITNTLRKNTDSDSDTKLPQTGQLWWPVPMLAMIGCSLLLIGWLRRKEFQDEA